MNRSLLIEKPSKLSYSNESIVVEQEDTVLTIPMCEIDALVIDNNQSVITTALISKLANAQIDTVLCDNKHLPDVRLSDVNTNANGSGRVFEQLSWGENVKSEAWLQIVANKMHNQIAMSEKLNGSTIKMPTSADLDNNEGILARMYFSRLFGKSFVRHAKDDINAMLNYGYALLLSRLAKIISSCGFLTQLGVHHCAKSNNYNFVCDVMEPFRPVVDKIAFYHREEQFGRMQKLAMLDVYNEKVQLQGRSFALSDAMSTYFGLVCDFLNGERDDIPEVRIG